MEQMMTETQTNEIAKLKQMAIDKYAEDYGVMCECFDSQDYIDDIVKYGTAEAAWVFHVRCVEAQRETQACYEVDAKDL